MVVVGGTGGCLSATANAMVVVFRGSDNTVAVWCCGLVQCGVLGHGVRVHVLFSPILAQVLFFQM